MVNVIVDNPARPSILIAIFNLCWFKTVFNILFYFAITSDIAFKFAPENNRCKTKRHIAYIIILLSNCLWLICWNVSFLIFIITYMISPCPTPPLKLTYKGGLFQLPENCSSQNLSPIWISTHTCSLSFWFVKPLHFLLPQ